MKINDKDSIFNKENDIVIVGYCVCDMYFPKEKIANFKKRRAFYSHIFYLTTKFGLYQLLISDELNYCDLEKVNSFEEPDIILENKLAEMFKKINYFFYILDDVNLSAIFAYNIFSTYTNLYVVNLGDYIASVDIDDYVDIKIYKRNQKYFKEVSYEIFSDIVFEVNLPLARENSLDAKLNTYKQDVKTSNSGENSSSGNEITR